MASAVKRILAFALWTWAARAQNAQLSGIIEDPSAVRVGGAEIVVRNEETGGRRATHSNDSGAYSIFSLNPGVYRISVHAQGFETIIREGIKLDVGENARLDFSLRIGDSRTEVTVRDTPPLLNTTDASVGTVIGRDIIEQMPLNGRGIQSLIELTPGVVVVPVVTSSRGQFVVNGQRSDTNYFTVDGMSANFGAGEHIEGRIGRASNGQAGGGMIPANNQVGTFSNLVSPDALQEFKIQTSTFAPEFGHSPGAQIGLITRSGGNRYTGSLFEYFRHDVTDANDWFANEQALARPSLLLDNFGGTLGGPLRVPPFYNGRDRTFFFLSVEDLRIAQAHPYASFPVPSRQARRNAPPAAAALLNLYPLPNQLSGPLGDPAVSGIGEFAGTYSPPQRQETYGLRIDHSFTDRWFLFTRYNRAPAHRFDPYEGFRDPSYSLDTEMFTVGVTHLPAPHAVNEIRFNASRQIADVTVDMGEPADGNLSAAALLYPAGFSPRDSTVYLHVPPLPDLFFGFGSQDRARQWQFVDLLSYSKGTHLLKFGADYRWFSPVQVQPRSKTFLSFSGLYGEGGVYGGTVPIVSLSVLDRTTAAYQMTSFAGFAQDTWRVNRRLVLTYGARWEVNPAPRVRTGEAAVISGISSLFDASTAHMVSKGEPFYPTRWGNVAPRFGAAWQLRNTSTATTVLRAGAGCFFDLAQAGFTDNGIFNTVDTKYVNQPLGAIAASSQVPAPPTFMLNPPIAAAPGYNLPRTYEWNVTMEQSIGPQAFSAGYIGALGRRLIGYSSVVDLGAFQGAEVLGNSARSSYHAMQLQYDRRLSGRLQMLVSYTWSHSLDNLSNDLNSDLLTRSVSQFLNTSIDRGPSDFDIRHSLNGAIMAELPSPKKGLQALLLRNWSANSIFFARTAQPTDLVDSKSTRRPDLVAGQPLYLYGSEYPGGRRFNDAAFADPAGDSPGTLGRNVLRGFGAWQIDFALHRTFRLSDQVSLQFRAEAFNMLNHPNFANPSEDANPWSLQLRHDPSFGRATAMLATGLGSTGVVGQLNPLFQIGGPRSMQFALRLRF